jgi:putative ABC transport system permease protein
MVLTSLRAAVRSLGASRGFTAVAVGTLGVGLALAITVAVVVNAYLVRALPYPAADRLYRLDYAEPGQNWPDRLERLDWRATDDVVEHLISWDLDVFYLLGAPGAHTQSVPGAWITPGYIRGLGVRAAVGRMLDDRDYQAGAPSVAVISHALWQSRFRGDAAAVGQTFRAYVSDRPDEAETFTIVGVLPPGFWHVNTYSEVLAPLRAPTYPYLVRVRDGVSRDVAADRLSSFVRAGLGTLPDTWRMRVTSLQESYVGTARSMLVAIAAGAGLVLVIAAANVAVLLLVRGRRREKDLAIRMALGASRAELTWLLVVEGLVLGAAATAAGLVASAAALRSLAPAVEQFLGRRVPGGTGAVAIDGTMLAIGLGCGLLVTLLFTLVPLASLRGSRLSRGLLGERGGTDSRALQRGRSVLIGVEVAGSITLLFGAGLMLQSALSMLRVDFGVDASRVVTASLTLRQRSYPDAGSRTTFFERLSAQLSGVVGSASVAVGDWWPLQARSASRVHTSAPARVEAAASIIQVTGEYFQTIGMPLLDGRAFTARDTAGAAPVVVVSSALARRLWPDARAIGQSLTIAGEGATGPGRTRQVVGVVGDVRQTHADTDPFDAYVPILQEPGRFAFIFLRDPRTSSWESDLRVAVASIDAEIALGASRRLDAAIEQERARPRFLAWLLAVYTVAACGLALVGMHGVIAYAVRQRQKEIAIRMAVGADAAAIVRLFIRQGAIVIAGGVVVGSLGAVALGRVLEGYLHGIRPAEPGLLLAAALAFAATALVAIWGPARRAAHTNAAMVLKNE